MKSSATDNAPIDFAEVASIGNGAPIAAPDDRGPLDAERSVLAAMMLDHESINRATVLLEPGSFYRPAHGRVFAAIVALYSRGEPADLVTVAEELRRRGDLDVAGGPPALASILEGASGANLDGHAQIVREAARNRGARRFALELRRDIEADPDRALATLAAHREAIDRMVGSDADHGRADRLVAATLSGPAILEHVCERRTSLLGDRIIAAGDLVLIFGRAKAGKTWVTLQLALAMARGELWFGIPTTTGPVPVGFLELELLGDAMQERLGVLGEAPETFHLVVRPALRGSFDLVNKDGTPVHLDELRRWIDAHGLKVVVIDALARATSCEQHDFSPLLLALDHLRADLNVAIIIVHHEGKPARNGHGEVDDLDAMRGDSRLSGFPQAILRVVKKAGNLYAIRFAGVSNGPTPDPIYFALGENGVPHPVSAPESVASGNREKVARTVLDANEPLRSGEVAKRTGLSDSTTRTHLGALVEAGEIGRTGNGRATTYHPLNPLSAESAESDRSAGASLIGETEL